MAETAHQPRTLKAGKKDVLASWSVMATNQDWSQHAYDAGSFLQDVREREPEETVANLAKYSTFPELMAETLRNIAQNHPDKFIPAYGSLSADDYDSIPENLRKELTQTALRAPQEKIFTPPRKAFEVYQEEIFGRPSRWPKPFFEKLDPYMQEAVISNTREFFSIMDRVSDRGNMGDEYKKKVSVSYDFS